MTDALTLLDGIREDNPHCVKDARVLAEAIIVERGADDGHWVITAKNFLTMLLLYIGLDPLEKDARTLLRLRQIVTLPCVVGGENPRISGADVQSRPPSGGPR
jgi:hypothetical protein